MKFAYSMRMKIIAWHFPLFYIGNEGDFRRLRFAPAENPPQSSFWKGGSALPAHDVITNLAVSQQGTSLLSKVGMREVVCRKSIAPAENPPQSSFRKGGSALLAYDVMTSLAVSQQGTSLFSKEGMREIFRSQNVNAAKKSSSILLLERRKCLAGTPNLANSCDPPLLKLIIWRAFTGTSGWKGA